MNNTENTDTAINSTAEHTTPILTLIQNELNIPKENFNKFGDFKYRTSEDIMLAIKPLLKKYNAKLYTQEDVRQVGDRYYFVETLEFIAPDEPNGIRVSCWRREAEKGKQMSESQNSGSTASYALKGALGLLFLISDKADDPDRIEPANNRQQYQQRQKQSNNAQHTQPKTSFTSQELGNYLVQVNGAKTRLKEIFDLAQGGNVKAAEWLRGTHTTQDAQAIKALAKLYRANDNAKQQLARANQQNRNNPQNTNNKQNYAPVNANSVFGTGQNAQNTSNTGGSNVFDELTNIANNN